MSAYQRFLPRHGTRSSTRVLAEVAEVAEVQAYQRPPSAEALLKPAEVGWRDLQLQQASAGVQQPQTLEIPDLQQLQQLQQQPPPTVAEMRDRDPVSDTDSSAEDIHREELPPGAPAEWTKGIARLAVGGSPRNYPVGAWQQLIIDGERFLDDWARQAAALGWPSWELFGCHRRAPFHRMQGMGLVLLLRGRELVALTHGEAVIRTGTAAHQTYRRKLHDPLHPSERCLVRELS